MVSSYLSEFREPGFPGSEVPQTDPGGSVSLNPGGTGRNFVDRTTGRCCFQSSDGEALAVVDAGGPMCHVSLLEGGDFGTIQPKQDNQVVLGIAGWDQCRTVTIVPSGEVSLCS